LATRSLRDQRNPRCPSKQYCSARSAGASRHSVGYMQRRSCHPLAARPIESLGRVVVSGPGIGSACARLTVRS
jgi:hypothetical protein